MVQPRFISPLAGNSVGQQHCLELCFETPLADSHVLVKFVECYIISWLYSNFVCAFARYGVLSSSKDLRTIAHSSPYLEVVTSYVSRVHGSLNLVRLKL
jgi:hypothetical protein